MLKKFLLQLSLAIGCALPAAAQITATPLPLQEDSKDVTVYYHADQGNKALAGLPASTQLYAHTGVLTSASKSDSDWKYDPTWGDNDAKYAMEYVSPNLYKLYIGDIRKYYGITNPAETIKKLAFVIRTADKDNPKQGKTAAGGDIFVDVLASGLQLALETSLDGQLITPDNAEVTFRLGATQTSDLNLSINGVTIAEKANTKLLEAKYTFLEPGTYTVYGNARDAEGKIVSTSLKLSYAKPSPQVNYPGGVPKMGCVRQPDGSVLFCLAAPQKTTVVLAGSWNDYSEDDQYTMNYQDYDGQRYFWTSVKGLDETSLYPYYFVVDGLKGVGDPYNDKYIKKDVYPDLPPYPTDKVRNVMLGVYQENINDYAWTDKDFKRPAKQDLVIYELLLRDFTGTEGRASGNGTVRQAIEKLPYLKQLGINAIELLPINEFNGNISWGYNPNFYFAPDKAYGTPDDYKELINKCHEMGIAVILDMVFNQSDGLHPWYQLYSPGANPFYNLDAPHAYSVLNDWNQGYGLVQRQWHDVIRYWMEEYKVDGYRFDLVKGLGDNDSYANAGDQATNAYNASRVARMRELQKVMETVRPDGYFINENLAGAQEENEMASTGQLNWANVNHESDQFAMGYQSESSLRRFYAPYDSRTWGSTVSYMESHDEQRLAYKQDTYGAAGVKGNVEMSMRRLGSTAAQMLMAPGAHMIWQFSELGNYDNTKNSNGGNNTDPKPVRWNLLDNEYRHGLYDSYRALIGIRNGNPEMFAEAAFYDGTCGSGDWYSGRLLTSRNGDKELFTVVNPKVDEELTMRVEFTGGESDYKVLAKSYATEPAYSVTGKTVTLAPGAFVVIGSASLTEIEEVPVESISALSVRGVAGALVIERAPEAVAVYDTTGRKVAVAEGTCRITLPQGIYIVRSGRETRKAIVR